VNVLQIYPNTVEGLVNKIPHLKFRLNLLDLSENKQIKEYLENLFEAIKKDNNVKSIEEISQKLNELIKKYPKNKKELEKLSQEISSASNKINGQNLIIEAIKNEFKEISTRDIFSNMVMKESLMFEFGKYFKTAHDASMGTVGDINFGAMSQLERKKNDEQTERIIKHILMEKEAGK